MDDTSHPNYPFPSAARVRQERAADMLIEEHNFAVAGYERLVRDFIVACRKIESPLGSLSKHCDMNDVINFLCDSLEAPDDDTIERAALDKAAEDEADRRAAA